MTKKKSSGDLPFTMEQLEREIDSLRPKTITHKNISDEQRAFILKCRDHQRPVPYNKMAVLWVATWGGEMSCSSMKNIAYHVLGIL